MGVETEPLAPIFLFTNEEVLMPDTEFITWFDAYDNMQEIIEKMKSVQADKAELVKNALRQEYIQGEK